MPATRLSRIARLACALQRWATCSPARCTIASRPASASRRRRFAQSDPSATASHRRRSVARARVGIAREHRHLGAALAQRGDQRAGRSGPSPRDGHTLADSDRSLIGRLSHAESRPAGVCSVA